MRQLHTFYLQQIIYYASILFTNNLFEKGLYYGNLRRP